MKHSPGFLKIVSETRPRVKELTIKDVQARLQKPGSFLLIDVREESEWNAGHLPHAIHVGKGVIERDIEVKVPDSNQEIILYCGGGYRSILAADVLQKMGYTNVWSMDGGFRDWKAAGGEVVS